MGVLHELECPCCSCDCVVVDVGGGSGGERAAEWRKGVQCLGRVVWEAAVPLVFFFCDQSTAFLAAIATLQLYSSSTLPRTVTLVGHQPAVCRPLLSPAPILRSQCAAPVPRSLPAPSLLQSFIMGLLLTQVFKVMVGRLRPNFLSRCQPIVPANAVFSLQNITASISETDNYPCSNTDLGVLKDGRQAFPSGQAGLGVVRGGGVLVGRCLGGNGLLSAGWWSCSGRALLGCLPLPAFPGACPCLLLLIVAPILPAHSPPCLLLISNPWIMHRPPPS